MGAVDPTRSPDPADDHQWLGLNTENYKSRGRDLYFVGAVDPTRSPDPAENHQWLGLNTENYKSRGRDLYFLGPLIQRVAPIPLRSGAPILIGVDVGLPRAPPEGRFGPRGAILRSWRAILDCRWAILAAGWAPPGAPGGVLGSPKGPNRATGPPDGPHFVLVSVASRS